MLCNTTQAELHPIKEALLHIMLEGPLNGDFGICHNVDMELRNTAIDCYPILRDLVQKWPDAVLEEDGEASECFIPSHHGPYPRGWRWLDKQGALRVQAMQFMLAEIDRRLAAPAALTA